MKRVLLNTGQNRLKKGEIKMKNLMKIVLVVMLGVFLTQALQGYSIKDDYPKKTFGPYDTLEEAEAAALLILLSDENAIHARVQKTDVSWECDDCKYEVVVWYRKVEGTDSQ